MIAFGNETRRLRKAANTLVDKWHRDCPSLSVKTLLSARLQSIHCTYQPRMPAKDTD